MAQPHTTIQDVRRLTGRTVTAADVERLAVLIPWSERELRAAAGLDWYDADDPDGAESEDWKTATAFLAVGLLLAERDDWQAATGPFKSVSLRGGYSYTLRDEATMAGTVLSRLPLVQAIVARYRVAASWTGFAMMGPAATFVRAEGGECEGDSDVSRRCC